MDTSYLNNPNLKRANIRMEFTQEQVQEWIKCSQDPLYFIKNYVKIINLDEGIIQFKPYDFQERLIETVENNRFVITKMPRQTGKCVKGNTFINIRNKKTGEIKEVPIGEFYEMLRMRKESEE